MPIDCLCKAAEADSCEMLFHVFTALLMAAARPSHHVAWWLEVPALFSHLASFPTLHNIYTP